ncbi:MAG: hypothetical protein EAZ95_05505 [Bacteroidetes bacterium]|nr:MAG: hypothetical protein EAZ95_05505 [Bacteroidota bacterium]
MEHLFFYIALAFLFVHEMDAMTQKEWLMFPLTFFLKDEVGKVVFILAHIPLYVCIFWALSTPSEALIQGLDIFCIVHAGLHVLFLWHPQNRFTSFLSWFFIAGGGFWGALDLLF